MADLINPIFRRAGEQSIASYDFTDIAEGTGTVIFYGITTEINSGVSRVLSENVLDSTTISTPNPAGSTEYDFDLAAFNLPRRVTGTAYFKCAIAGGSNAADTIYVTVIVKKYDGSTETNISSEIQSQTVASSTTEQVLMPIPLTETSFKKGEILRMTVKVVAGAGGVQDTKIYHDPTGSYVDLTGSNASPVMQLNVPFDLDL